MIPEEISSTPRAKIFSPARTELHDLVLLRRSYAFIGKEIIL